MYSYSSGVEGGWRERDGRDKMFESKSVFLFVWCV